MIMSRRWTGLVLVVFLTVTVVYLSGGLSAADFDPYNVGWDGTSTIHSSVEDGETGSYVSLTTARYERVPSAGTVAVVLSPERGYTEREVRRIRSFLAGGGTLIVAADFELRANQLLDRLGVRSRFDGRLLRDEQNNHRSSGLPIVRNVSDPRYVAVGQITFNHGTAIDPNGAEVLATASGLSYLDTNRNGTLDRTEPLRAHPVITRESVDGGEVILIGDPSVFLNGMLERSGNRVFASGFLTRYDRVLFDYSHARNLPLQTRALILLRSSPAAQATTAVVSLLLILLAPLLYGRGSGRTGLSVWSRDGQGGLLRPLTEEEMVESLMENGFTVDEEQARRIVATIPSRVPVWSDDD